MKAVINEKETPGLDYPKLMTFTYPHSGSTVVVLFTEPNCGVTLDVKNGTDVCLDEVGDYFAGWEESGFTPFTGTITLSND